MFAVYLINLKYNCVLKHFIIIRHVHLIDISFLRLLKPGFEMLFEAFLYFKLLSSPFIGT